jgi:hypothetical protein
MAAKSSFYYDTGDLYTEISSVNRAYDLPVFVGGDVLTADEVLFAHVPDIDIYFEANFGDSVASALIAATAPTELSIRKNDVEFGTLTYTDSTGVFSCSETSFVRGDLLTVQAPSTPDATLAGLAMTLLAQRT